MQIALARHPSTQRTWWNAQRAAAAVGSEESTYYPKIDAIGEARYRDPDAERTYTARLSLDLLLFDFGRRDAAVAAAKELLHQAAWQTDWNVQKVLLDVCEASYGVLHAQEVCEATHLSLEEAQKMCEAAEELNRAGLKPITDVFTSKASLARARMEESERKASLLTSLSQLAVNIGVEANTPISLQPIDTKAIFTRTTVLDELLAQAYAERADLQAKRAEYQATLFQAAKEDRAYMPEVSLFGEKEEALRRKKQGTPPSKNTSRSGASSFGVKVTIPLFVGFDSIYKTRQALSSANMTQAELLELQNEISQEVAAACYSLEAAQEMLPLAKEALDNRVKAYESAFERYKIGEATMAELHDAQEDVSAARIQYSDVKQEWLSAIAKLAYATGTRS